MPNVFVGEITSSRLDEVAQVLSEAFSDYEAMRYLLGESDQNYAARLQTLVGYFAESRVAVGSPLLGVDVGRPPHLVAAALVDPPRQPPDLALETLTQSLGSQVTQKIHYFETALAPLEPDFDFYYLGMIGVANGHRGKGYGRLIIDQIIRTSAKDLHSNGVLLTTERETNLAYYSSIGFETLGEVVTEDGGLRSWTMFRRDA
jgi:ribosomal protein S18 acetylase RimI-like enzyme